MIWTKPPWLCSVLIFRGVDFMRFKSTNHVISMWSQCIMCSNWSASRNHVFTATCLCLSRPCEGSYLTPVSMKLPASYDDHQQKEHTVVIMMTIKSSASKIIIRIITIVLPKSVLLSSWLIMTFIIAWSWWSLLSGYSVWRAWFFPPSCAGWWNKQAQASQHNSEPNISCLTMEKNMSKSDLNKQMLRDSLHIFFPSSSSLKYLLSVIIGQWSTQHLDSQHPKWSKKTILKSLILHLNICFVSTIRFPVLFPEFNN